MSVIVKLTVTGMKCGGCEKTIKEKLGAAAGIISVNASHNDDLVEAEIDESIISEDDIIELIEEAGFTVED